MKFLTLPTSCIAFIGFFTVVGCSSTAPNPSPDLDLLPTQYDKVSTYHVTNYDFEGHSSFSEQSTRAVQTPYGTGKSFEWDSTLSDWREIPYLSAYGLPEVNWCGWMRYVAYAPYSRGEEKGLLCGFDGNSGPQYWFRLPQHPVHPLHFSVPTFQVKEKTFVAGGQLKVDVDTGTYSVQVPAGSFQSVRWILRFVGRQSVNDSLITIDTFYSSPGVGIVKYAKHQIMRALDSTQLFPSAQSLETYELMH